VIVKPHFVDPDPGERPEIGTDFLYLGRLTDDKGVRGLVEAWESASIDARIRLAGDGPLAGFVREAAERNPAIVYDGPIPQTAVFDAIAASRALIVSTRMYETFGLGIVQAFAVGRPVIAPSRGSAAELVADGVTGVHFDPDAPSSLVAAIQRLSGSLAEASNMGAAARAVFEARYTGAQNHELLMGIYRRATELAAVAVA
jgi:glycosyltransferase involved in cell wall biosynthesis